MLVVVAVLARSPKLITSHLPTREVANSEHKATKQARRAHQQSAHAGSAVCTANASSGIKVPVMEGAMGTTLFRNHAKYRPFMHSVHTDRMHTGLTPG